jgi:predicted nucleic acid-binding protein
MPQQNVYIDTDILMFYYDKKEDKRRAARSSIMQVERSLDENHEIKVKISQVVLGELMMHYCNGKCESEEIKNLFVKLNIGNSDLPSVSLEALACAKEILDVQRRINPNDALIVAQVLNDSLATWFLTTDTKLIGNKFIEEKMDALGHRFTINSSFH